MYYSITTFTGISYLWCMRTFSVPNSRDTMFVVPWYNECAPIPARREKDTLIMGYITLLLSIELQGRITKGDNIRIELMIRDDCIIRRAQVVKEKRIVDFEKRVGVKVWDKLIDDYTSDEVVINIGNEKVRLVPRPRTGRWVDIYFSKGNITVKRQDLDKVFRNKFGVSYRDTIIRMLVDNIGKNGYAPSGKIMIGEYYIKYIGYDHGQKLYFIYMERDKEAKGYNVRSISVKAGNAEYGLYSSWLSDHSKWIGYKVKEKYYLIVSAIKPPEIKPYCIRHEVIPIPLSPCGVHPECDTVEAKNKHLRLFMMFVMRSETGSSRIYASLHPNMPTLNVDIPIVLYAPRDTSTPYKNEISYAPIDISGFPLNERYLVCQEIE